MGQKKITELPAASIVNDVDSLIAVQGGTTKKAAASLVRVPVIPDWSSALTYSQDDFLTYGGSLYKSLQNGNTAKTPGSEPAWWESQNTSAIAKNLTADTGTDIVIKLGDNAGANILQITDSDDSEVAKIDSDGNAEFLDITSGNDISATNDIIADAAIKAGTYYTAKSGNLAFLVPTNQDCSFKLGDNAGSNKISFLDSDEAEIAFLDSDGKLSIDENIEVGGDVVAQTFSSGSGNDIDLKLGDNAGSNKITFTKLDETEIAYIDSNGNFGCLTINGLSGEDLEMDAASGQDLIFKIGDSSGSNKFSIIDTQPDEIFYLHTDSFYCKPSGYFENNLKVEELLHTKEIDATEWSTSLYIVASTGYDIRFKLGDNTGGNYLSIRDSGDVEVATIDSDGFIQGKKLSSDQNNASAGIPSLYLKQSDISEEMIEFDTTIGVGNPIEAVGAKTLTTTHFIKITIPGGLTRYIPCGTIA